MNPTNESIGRAFREYRANENSTYGGARDFIINRARELDRQAPGEWVMVPVSPTGAMIKAYDDSAHSDWTFSGAGYEAMLAAAPQPPAQEQGECVRHECRRVRIEMQDEIDRLRAAGAEDARDAQRYRVLRKGLSDAHGDCYAMTFAEDGDYPVCGADLDIRADRMVARSAISSQAKEGANG